ncbi:hypothetical protein [Scytonema sp. HK-05]|uniref:hypothetical protein n=1 Tax=Scytonema sp. HK-05 TaxID=1137095 RepID=UPI0009368EEB|nr:hypothetical protein NIES2130_39140 [Scytonema sp. HK-05]
MKFNITPNIRLTILKNAIFVGCIAIASVSKANSTVVGNVTLRLLQVVQDVNRDKLQLLSVLTISQVMTISD